MEWSYWDSVNELVGLTGDEAAARADVLGLSFRDITSGSYTEDLRSLRVNVTCDDAGLVTSAVIF